MQSLPKEQTKLNDDNMIELIIILLTPTKNKSASEALFFTIKEAICNLKTDSTFEAFRILEKENLLNKHTYNAVLNLTKCIGYFFYKNDDFIETGLELLQRRKILSALTFNFVCLAFSYNLCTPKRVRSAGHDFFEDCNLILLLSANHLFNEDNARALLKNLNSYICFKKALNILIDDEKHNELVVLFSENETNEFYCKDSIHTLPLYISEALENYKTNAIVLEKNKNDTFVYRKISTEVLSKKLTPETVAQLKSMGVLDKPRFSTKESIKDFFVIEKVKSICGISFNTCNLINQDTFNMMEQKFNAEDKTKYDLHGVYSLSHSLIRLGIHGILDDNIALIKKMLNYFDFTSGDYLKDFTRNLVILHKSNILTPFTITILIENYNYFLKRTDLITNCLLRLNQFSICNEKNVLLLAQSVNNIVNVTEDVIAEQLKNANTYNKIRIHSMAIPDIWRQLFGFFEITQTIPVLRQTCKEFSELEPKREKEKPMTWSNG